MAFSLSFGGTGGGFGDYGAKATQWGKSYGSAAKSFGGAATSGGSAAGSIGSSGVKATQWGKKYQTPETFGGAATSLTSESKAGQRVMSGNMRDGSQMRAITDFAKGQLPSSISAGGNTGPNTSSEIGSNQSLLGLAYGGAQTIAGLAQKNRADNARPGETDPMRVSAMYDFKRKANSMFTGSALQSNLRDIMQGRGGAYKALARQGGPNVLRNMQFQSRLEGQQLNQLLGQAQSQEKFYEKMFQQEMVDIEERRMAIQSQKYGEMRAKSEANISGGISNIYAGSIGLAT